MTCLLPPTAPLTRLNCWPSCRSRKVMDMRELRRLAYQGVPDATGIRSSTLCGR